jgi:hypothetical protein
MLSEKNANFLLSKQGIFCWNNLLSNYEEGDVKGITRYEQGTFRSKILHSSPRPSPASVNSRKIVIIKHSLNNSNCSFTFNTVFSYWTLGTPVGVTFKFAPFG